MQVRIKPFKVELTDPEGKTAVLNNVKFLFTYDRITEIYFMDGSSKNYSLEDYKVRRMR